MSQNLLTSPIGQKMITYLPEYYETSKVMKAILQSQGMELDKFRQALDQILNQFFVETVEWGLDFWEKELGLKIMPDQPASERRAKIFSKLRSHGTANITQVKRVAEVYDLASIDVSEDFSSHTVIFRFVETTGVPPNIFDLQEMIQAIIPAHLKVMYIFNYFTWDNLETFNWTWDDLEALNLTWDRLEVYD